MQLFVFSSNNLTNIWAGVGAGKWAVSKTLAEKKGTITKSKNLKVGSLGILYCSETQEFTTPFIVKAAPQEGTIIKDIWPEPWGLAFAISPLGSPKKRLSKDVVAKEMPSLVNSKKRWNHLLNPQPSFSFQASEISAEDWAFLYSRLGE